MSDQYAVIGAPYADHGGVSNSGFIYLYKRTGIQWAFVTSTGAYTPEYENNFGKAVAVCDPAATWVFASCNSAITDGHRGVVIAHVLYPDGLHDVTSIRSPWLSGAEETSFGESLSVYGNYLAVGSPDVRNENAGVGRVYVFKYGPGTPIQGTGWSRHWKLVRTIVDNNSYPDRFQSKDAIGSCVYVNGFDIGIGNPYWDYGKGKVLFLNVE
jgi:hypothetical protein